MEDDVMLLREQVKNIIYVEEKQRKWNYLLVPFIVTIMIVFYTIAIIILLIGLGILTLLGYGEYED